MGNIVENKFSVRPKPVEGESLTSYFLRLAKNNYLSLDEFFYVVKSDYKKSSRQLHIIDTIPKKGMDLDLLEKLLKCNSRDIAKMSFTNVFLQFFNDKEEALANYRSVMPEMIEKGKRKFCCYCLEETGVYKLVWQIKDIEICDIHQIKLQSKCSSCSKEQPYVSLELANHSCHSPLTNPSTDGSYTDISLINNQLQKYQDWYFLMNSDKSLAFGNIPGLHKEKQLAISYIYLYTDKANTFDIKTIPQKERSYIRGLVRFLNDGGSILKVTLLRLFRLLKLTFLLMESYQIKKLSGLGSSVDLEKRVKMVLKNQIIQSETKISIKGVAGELGCSLKALRTNNLVGLIVAERERQKQLYIKSFTVRTKKNVKKYLDDKIDLLEVTTSVKEIYLCIEKDENWVRRNTPELHKWIVNKKREANIIIKKQSQHNLKKTIEEAVGFHISSGIEPTFERVLNHIGFNRAILQERPIYKDMIIEARAKLGIIQKQR